MPQHWTLAIDKCPRQQYNIGNYPVSGALASEVALMVTHEGCYVGASRKIKELLVTIVPLQLLAYYLAVARGSDPDKPRNLAKVSNGKIG